MAPRPKPGIMPLRPIALGEMFDSSFQAIRSNPRTMIGLSAAVLAVTTVIGIIPQAFWLQDNSDLMAKTSPTMADLLAFMSSSLESGSVSLLLTMIATQIVTSMLVLAVSSAVRGRRMSPGEAWRRARGRLPAVFGLALTQTAALAGVLLLPIAPGALIAATGPGGEVAGVVLMVLGLLCGLALVIFLSTRWSFSAPALLLEEQRVFAAMRRSFGLVRGSFWRVLGILLLTQLIVSFGSGLISLPFGLLSWLLQLLSGSRPYQDVLVNVGQLLVGGIGEVIAGAVFYPFTAAVTTLLYIDVRMRREGLDVELMRAAESGTGA